MSKTESTKPEPLETLCSQCHIPEKSTYKPQKNHSYICSLCVLQLSEIDDEDADQGLGRRSDHDPDVEFETMDNDGFAA